MRRTPWPLLLPLLFAWIFAPIRALAHDLPTDVTVQAFFKPTGDSAQLVVRLPLKAMRDIQFPEKEGYLDIARADPLLEDAAVIWVSHLVEVFENDTPSKKRFCVTSCHIHLFQIDEWCARL